MRSSNLWDILLYGDTIGKNEKITKMSAFVTKVITVYIYNYNDDVCSQGSGACVKC